MTNFLSLENIIYVYAALAIAIIILLAWNIRLELKTRRLMRGKSGRSLEDAFIAMQKELDGFEEFRGEMEKYLSGVESRLRTSLRGFSNVNFSAFKGMESGGKSFATALLNEKGDGIIISSLHARDHVSIFTKEVKNYKTEVEMSEEEEQALTNARNSCKV
jgi:hypothetical protein